MRTVFWLILVWIILLFVSLWLSSRVLKQLKKYEKSIRESNKDIIFQSRQAMLGELLPMIAHQWRQPLNKISSVLMRMRFEIMSGKTNTQTLDRQSQLIEDSVELMSQTIDDFRTFYRPKEEPQEVDIAVLVRKASYFLDELLKRKKIALNQDLTSVTLKIHANEFLQVIINLIKNASDAVAVRGEINILLREFSDGRVELRIEDNGTGIPKDKLEKIFEAHESSKQASMGLGLYMSKLIIEDHFGGKIQAYNTPRGAGFLIVLYKGGVSSN
jgi:signal transduction histidine kinase